jgi:hypothetical protein
MYRGSARTWAFTASQGLFGDMSELFAPVSRSQHHSMRMTMMSLPLGVDERLASSSCTFVTAE